MKEIHKHIVNNYYSPTDRNVFDVISFNIDTNFKLLLKDSLKIQKFRDKYSSNNIIFREYVIWLNNVLYNENIVSFLTFINKRNLIRWIDKGINHQRGVKFDKDHDKIMVAWIKEYYQKNYRYPSFRKIQKNAVRYSNNLKFKASKGWYQKFISRNNDLIIKLRKFENPFKKADNKIFFSDLNQQKQLSDNNIKTKSDKDTWNRDIFDNDIIKIIY